MVRRRIPKPRPIPLIPKLGGGFVPIIEPVVTAPPSGFGNRAPRQSLKGHSAPPNPKGRHNTRGPR